MDEIKLAQEFVEVLWSVFGGNANTIFILRDSLAKQMKEDKEVKENIERFMKTAKEQGISPKTKNQTVVMNVSPEYSKILFDICRNNKPEIAYCPLGIGENQNSVTILKKQEKDFNEAVKEAMVRSGYKKEVSLEEVMARKTEGIDKASIADKMHRHGNDLKIMSDITPDQYRVLRQDIERLGIQTSLAISKPYEKNGISYVKVGFPSKTEAIYDKIGNVYKKPPVYDMQAVMTALVLKKNMLEKSDTCNDIIEDLKGKETFRENRILSLMNNDSPTYNSIELKIKESSIDVKTQINLLSELEKVKKGEITADVFLSRMQKMDKVPDRMKQDIQNDFNELGKSKYIVPARMERAKDGSINYVILPNESLQIGKVMTMRKDGIEERTISDRSEMRSVLKEQLRNMQERTKGRFTHTFIELSEDEYKKIMERSPEYMDRANILKKDKIKFLKDNEQSLKDTMRRKPVSQMDEYEKMANHIIKTMDERLEEFLLKTDGDIVDGISVIESGVRTLIENPTITSGTVANKEQSNVETEKDETLIEENLDALNQEIIDTYDEMSELDSATSFEETMEEATREDDERDNHEHEEARDSQEYDSPDVFELM